MRAAVQIVEYHESGNGGSDGTWLAGRFIGRFSLRCSSSLARFSCSACMALIICICCAMNSDVPVLDDDSDQTERYHIYSSRDLPHTKNSQYGLLACGLLFLSLLLLAFSDGTQVPLRVNTLRAFLYHAGGLQALLHHTNTLFHEVIPKNSQQARFELRVTNSTHVCQS